MLYMRMIERGHPMTSHPRFTQRLQKIRASNAAAAATLLDHGIATPMGENVLAEIRRMNDQFAAA
jgi:hypothetical protein